MPKMPYVLLTTYLLGMTGADCQLNGLEYVASIILPLVSFELETFFFFTLLIGLDQFHAS